jgi:4-hydroxybenzoate polyprenyltransferase
LLDLLAVRGDRLVGRETLVVLVGERRTTYFMAGVLALLALSAVFGPAAGLSTGFAFALLPVAAAYGWQLRRCLKSRMREDPLCETLIESVLIGFGFLAWLWLGVS